MTTTTILSRLKVLGALGLGAPLVVLLMMAMLVVAIFYVRSYSKSGYAGFLERAFDRAFFPAAVMLWVAAIGTLGMARIQRRQISSSTQAIALEDSGK